MDGSCFPMVLVGVIIGLTCVDGLLAILAFFQLLRIHSRNSHLGWTRQKVFHLMIGSSNLGYFIYLVLTLVAACKGWVCWSDSCGFIVMEFCDFCSAACPNIIFLAAFLLLLSFWVDLCHQSNDDDEDDRYGSQEALLERTNKARSEVHSVRNCFSFPAINVGSRQKVVILVTLLIFALMIISAVLIWIGIGSNPSDSSVVARVYVDLFAIIVLVLGGALASYGLVLFLRMSRVRSEMVSSEKWKVAGLAGVSVLCFTSNALVAIFSDIPLLYQWQQQTTNGVFTSLLLMLYYFLGSSVPSAFVLWVMRELPPLPLINREEESSTITFVSESLEEVHPHAEVL